MWNNSRNLCSLFITEINKSEMTLYKNIWAVNVHSGVVMKLAEVIVHNDDTQPRAGQN